MGFPLVKKKQPSDKGKSRAQELPLGRKPTIRDVADACGLAPSTVSNALADKAIVRPETKKFVRDVADSLGFKASTMAKALRTGKTFTIGMVVSDITNPFYAEIFRGVEETLSTAGYHLLLANTDFDATKQSLRVRHLAERQIDGLILSSCSPDTGDVEHLVRAGVPVVLLMRRHKVPVGHVLDFCGLDNRHGMNAALNHLFENGHRRIGLINGPNTSSNSAERLAEFGRFAVKHFGELDPNLITEGPYSLASGQRNFMQLMSLDNPPSAIVCSQDEIALGAMIKAETTKLRVPQDVSLIGWDDTPVCALPQINLTTIRAPKWDLGANAARMMISRIQNPEPREEEILMRPELVIRGSVAPVAGKVATI